MNDVDLSSLQYRTTVVWENLYVNYQAGVPLGIQSPTEALVRFIANIRKDPYDRKGYFDDIGCEYSVRGNYSGVALEIGFGSIANLNHVRSKGFACHGIEVSEEAVKRGNMGLAEGGREGIELSVWNPPNIPYPDNTFEIVYGLQCIYYNLNLESVVSEIERVLKPDGRFLFSFFSSRHTYMDYVEIVEEPVCRWSANHPNKRLAGAYFVQPSSEEQLLSYFQSFKNVRVFYTETDQTPLVESWWYIEGQKA